GEAYGFLCRQQRRSRATKRSSSAHTSAMRPTIAKRSAVPSRVRSTRTGRGAWFREAPGAARRECAAGKRRVWALPPTCWEPGAGVAVTLCRASDTSHEDGAGGRCARAPVQCRAEKNEKVSREA